MSSLNCCSNIRHKRLSPEFRTSRIFYQNVTAIGNHNPDYIHNTDHCFSLGDTFSYYALHLEWIFGRKTSVSHHAPHTGDDITMDGHLDPIKDIRHARCTSSLYIAWQCAESDVHRREAGKLKHCG